MPLLSCENEHCFKKDHIDNYYGISVGWNNAISENHDLLTKPLYTYEERHSIYMVKNSKFNRLLKDSTLVKKDDKALDKLFALCNKIPEKFKSKEDYMRWVEQGD